MLEEIRIQNLGIINDVTIPLTKGLNVITGETGAGKTMILSALGLLLGKRSDAKMLNNPHKTLSVEGIWDLTTLKEKDFINDTGAVIEDDQLFINRTINSEGKSRAVIGGKTTPASVLSSIGSKLVNIHGQSDQIRLRNNNAQREALDLYSGKELSSKISCYEQSYKEWVKATKTLKDVKENSTQRKREINAIQKFINDFDRISPEPGELDELVQELKLLSNNEKLREYTQEAIQYLNPMDYSESDGISEIFDLISGVLSKILKIDSRISEPFDKIQEAIELFDEAKKEIESYYESFDEDASFRFNEIQERVNELKTFVRVHGEDLDDVIEQREKADDELIALQKYSQPIEELEKNVHDAWVALENNAKELTKIRKTKAKELSEKVNHELKGLSMESSELVITITEEKPTINGVDFVEFMLKNSNKEPQPITKTASGGELSRIMLALEVVLANPEITPTFVFDEVDSGVGGKTAIEIGKRLSQLSKDAQVIVVTHLPQVSCFSDNHLKVIKKTTSTNVVTTVEKLNKEQKLIEITRMLSGMTESDSGKAHACDLVNFAEEFKNNS